MRTLSRLRSGQVLFVAAVVLALGCFREPDPNNMK